MELKAFPLLPSHFDDAEIKFDLDVITVSMVDNSQMELDVIKVNCSSLSDMATKVSEYFNEVVKRPPKEMNILMATYLGMIDMLLRDHPNGFPIRDDILNIIHESPEYKRVKSDTGYYFQFKIDDWLGVQRAVIKQMCLH